MNVIITIMDDGNEEEEEIKFEVKPIEEVEEEIEFVFEGFKEKKTLKGKKVKEIKVDSQSSDGRVVLFLSLPIDIELTGAELMNPEI